MFDRSEKQNTKSCLLLLFVLKAQYQERTWRDILWVCLIYIVQHAPLFFRQTRAYLRQVGNCELVQCVYGASWTKPVTLLEVVIGIRLTLTIIPAFDLFVPLLSCLHWQRVAEFFVLQILLLMVH